MRVRFCHTLRNILKAKLFYSVWIRYMIESNLKVTHNCVFFLAISGSFSDTDNSLSTSTMIILLSIIVLWPIFVTTFLLCNKGPKLTQPRFKRKCLSMYTGVKVKQYFALIYTAVFCARRLTLVISLLLLQHHEYSLILVFNLIQTFYFWYMAIVEPHEESIHNRLEFFNELCVIVMQYLMVFFISGSQVDPRHQWEIGKAVVGIVIVVFTVNMIALIYLTVYRVIFWCRIRKARQAFLKSKVRRGAIRRLPSSEINKLNDARSISRIMERIMDDDDGSVLDDK